MNMTHTPRRNRAELELLAAEFVHSDAVPQLATPRVPKAVLAGGAVAVIALLAWTLWPEAGTAAVRETPVQVAEAQAWAQRLEAERERKRRELQSGRDYLAKMAASDSALLDEMTVRAQSLATRAAEPSPASSRAAEPTPRTEPVKPQPAPARAETRRAEPTPPAATQVAATPAPQQAAPATAPPVVVAQAAASSCRIHVSELSSSGKLSYADIGRMKGASTDERGHVFTPPVPAANGRTVVFEVSPDGCVRVARTAR